MKFLALFLVLFPLTSAHVKKCPEDWRDFNRDSGRWCIHVFAGDINRHQAQARCEALGATLSGVQNAEEKHYIHTEGVNILRAQGMKYGSLWLGMLRKNDCRGGNAKNAACKGSSGFYWSDGATSNKNMMTWDGHNPDNNGGNQNCVHMYLVDGVSGPNGVRPGNLDDIQCDASHYVRNSLQSVRAYVCGKRPV